MSRFLKIKIVLVLSLGLPALALGQAAVNKAGNETVNLTAPVAKVDKPQMTNIPYYTLRDGLSSTLTLNNLTPRSTPVTVTVFNTEGRAQTLDPITLDPHAFKQIELKDVLGGNFDSGNIQINYLSDGTPMVVTCQLSVYSLEKRVSFESREQDMMDFESSNLNGIVSLPQKGAHGFLAITNVSTNQVTAKLTVGSKTQETKLFARETKLVKIDEEFGIRAPAAALAKLSIDGVPGDVITTGFVLNMETGYSSAFTMFDPKIMRSSLLAGAHIRFGQANPDEGFPDGTEFRAPLLLANVGDKPLQAHVSVDYTVQEKVAVSVINPKSAPSESKFSTVTVKDVPIAPGEVQRVELSEELAKLGVAAPVEEAGVEIAYDAAPGSLIAQMTNLDKSGDYSFEVPIKDPEATNEMVEGFYPWTIENGVRSVIHLKNATDKLVYALATIVYSGGTYNLERVKLQPHQTVAIDIQKLKDSKKPDVRGQAFPIGITHGTILWREEAVPHSLVARAEQVDAKSGIARSFSCGSPCCGINQWNYYLTPGSIVGAVGGSSVLAGQESGNNCQYVPFGPYNVAPDAWWSDNTALASVDGSGNVSYIGGGQTNIWGAWYSATMWSDDCHETTGEVDSATTATSCDFTITPGDETLTPNFCDGLHDNSITFQAVNIPNGCTVVASSSTCADSQSGSVHVDDANTYKDMNQYYTHCVVAYTAGPGSGNLTEQMTLQFYTATGTVQHTSSQTISCP